MPYTRSVELASSVGSEPVSIITGLVVAVGLFVLASLGGYVLHLIQSYVMR